MNRAEDIHAELQLEVLIRKIFGGYGAVGARLVRCGVEEDVNVAEPVFDFSKDGFDLFALGDIAR